MTCVRTTIIAKHAEDIRRQGEGGIRLPFQMYDNPVLHALFQIVYLISKTRGYKHIIKLFPHEVADLEPALQLLLSQDRSNHETWETRYVLFLWLSILVLVPFDLATADSFADAAGTGTGHTFTCTPPPHRCFFVCDVPSCRRLRPTSAVRRRHQYRIVLTRSPRTVRAPTSPFQCVRRCPIRCPAPQARPLAAGQRRRGSATALAAVVARGPPARASSPESCLRASRTSPTRGRSGKPPLFVSPGC